ncbi:hypothetical protein SO802_014724 [Lithocarpus litseifolius]|uniref:RNase H type-1 domain-containing protein n=1 Tax=Lithocarpus litseifolius TaxID=425828 RepID=A0AAW2CTU1_9ROSI
MKENNQPHGSSSDNSKFVLQGVIKFYGVANSTASSTNGAVQEALMKAVTKARNYGFQWILFLTNNKNLVQLINKKKKPAWQGKTLIADLEILYPNGLFCNLLVVPKVVLDVVYTAANLATKIQNANSPKLG